MTTVLSKVDENFGIIKTHAPKRPKELKCDIHQLTVKGVRWIVIVGIYHDDPYEVFAFKEKQIHLPKKFKEGSLVKIKKGVYDLIEDTEDTEEGLRIENIGDLFQSDEEEALTRMISTALRHGAYIKFVVEQLNKSEGTVSSFSKAIARTLKKYLKEEDLLGMNATCESCGSQKLAIEDGCYKCLDCGSSKCS